MDPQLDPLLGLAGDAQVLDAVAELRGIADVLGGDGGDPLGVDLVVLEGDAEGDGSQDGELVGGVDALDVQGGIGLGVAAALGLRQGLLEVPPLMGHLAEDEVAGAVDNPCQPLDAVAGEPLPDRLDDGDPPRHRRLEGHHHPLALGGVEDVVAVDGDKRLVGGDYMLAVLDGTQHQGAGRLDPPHELHHHRQLGVVHDGPGIGGELDPLGGAGARLFEIPERGPFDQDAAPRPAADVDLIAGEHGDRAAAHGAEAEKTHGYGLQGWASTERCFLNMCLIPRMA